MRIDEKCSIINFQDFGDERGKLVVIEGNQSIPFEIARVFYIYGSDNNVIRGQHANRLSEFVLINICGSSKVKVDDGYSTKIFELDKPMMGLYIPQMIWKDMYEFSSDSILLVVSSTHYNEKEYIRDYNFFVQEIKNER